VGQCYVESIQAYALGLTSDFITSGATGSSDHGPFWQRGVGAVEVLENYFSNPGLGCNGVSDHNPNYHQVTDTVLNSFPPYNAGQPNTLGADIARAGLGAVAGLAGNRGACFSQAPDVTDQDYDGYYHITWAPLPGATEYRIYKQVHNSSPSLVYHGTGTAWTDYYVVVGWDNIYWIEAVAADGICQSEARGVGLAYLVNPVLYLPVVKK
jgi:hypothetical protein